MSCDLAQAAAAALRPDFARLERVWAQLGLVPEDAVVRRGEVVGHLARMVSGMAAEEERQRDEILRSVAENRARVVDLERELEMTPSPCTASGEDTSLLRLDTELEERCEALELERERRLEEKVELESRAESLRASLVLADAEAVDLSLRHDISMTGLVRLREIVGEYEKKLEARRKEAGPAVAACQALMRDMDYEPDGDFEAQVAKGLDRLSLSSSTLEALRELRERLEDKRARLSADVAQLYASVEQLWKELDVSPTERKACLKALGGDPARLPATCAAMKLLRKEHRRLNEVRVGDGEGG
jgi:chromosome segregation ATPase